MCYWYSFLIIHMQQLLFLQAISIHFCLFNHEIYQSLTIYNLFHFRGLPNLAWWCADLLVRRFPFFLCIYCEDNDKSTHCLLFHWSFSGYFIWFDLLYFALGKFWTGDIGKIWIPITVQILPVPAVQMLPSPQKFENCPILRHVDLCHKADINKMYKTPSLIIAMFKTKPKTND